MYENVVSSLNKLVDFNEEELFLFMQRLKPRSLQKNELLLREGDVCRAMTIVDRGALRCYGLSDKGEQSFWFAFEGEWLGDYRSFLTQSPSICNIQALETTEVLSLHFEDMQYLYAKGVKFERFGRLIAENLFLAAAGYSTQLTTLSAKERYLKLLAEQPHILRRVPQQYVATYLGIQPQSLSRIRATLGTGELT